MSLDQTLVTVTLPRWYLERLSEEVENESIYYSSKIRCATPKATAGHLELIRSWKTRWDAIGDAITDALDASEVTA